MHAYSQYLHTLIRPYSVTDSGAVHPTSSLTYYRANANMHQPTTLPALSNLISSNTSSAHYIKPRTQHQEHSKHLPSHQPSSTTAYILEHTPQPGDTSASNTTLQSFKIIAGATVAGVLIIIVLFIVIVVATVMIIVRKKRPKTNHLQRDDSMISNAAYVTGVPRVTLTTNYRKGDTYDYPRFGHRIQKQARGNQNETSSNEAAVPVEINQSGNAYTTDTTSGRNAAYGTSASSDNREFDQSENIVSLINAFGRSLSSLEDEFASSITSRSNLVHAGSLSITNEDELEYSYIRHR